MSYNVNTPVHVDIRLDGEEIVLDLKAGDQDLDPRIAEVLIAQGIAEQAKPKTSKTTTPDPVTSEE